MIRWKGLSVLIPVLALALFSGCAVEDNDDSQRPGSPPASNFDSEVAASWFTLSCDLIKEARLSPPVAARQFGYEGIALYEAVVPGSADHRSLVGLVNGLPSVPQPRADAEYHWPTVASSAFASLLRHFYANGPASALSRIQALENQFRDQYLPTLAPGVHERSVQQGQLVAATVFDWCVADGYAELNNCSFTPPSGPGLWEPTPPAFASPLQPCWGNMRTFIPLLSETDCAPPGPPVYSEDPASAFYGEARQVYDVCTNATPEQQATAAYWADNPGATATPPGHSVSIVNQLVRQQHLALDDAAEVYARVGMAVGDAFVLCWRSKFQHNLMRPVTYVQRFIDPAWLPPLPTPPFPEYTSGHSVQSGAVAQVLTDMLGDMPFTDSTHVVLGMAPRYYPSFTACAEEAAISRLYGGIHFSSAIQHGLEQGRCVGRRVSSLVLAR